MSTKPFILSSSGLKNIVLTKYQNGDDFTFIFGEEKLRMKSIFAEFISPVVSHFHQTDPTINTIDFSKIVKMKQGDFNKLSKSLITPDAISHLQQLSSGSAIKIDESEALKLRFLSIILGNDELNRKLNKLFPTNYSEENLSTYMNNIDYLYHFSQISETIDFSSTVSFIASHFTNVNVDDFLRASREIQYMIISHDELQIESEDSLFDIITQIIEKKNDDDKIEDFLFYEQIEFACLSESKFIDFVTNFDFNSMSYQLWRNLSQCFFPHTVKKCQRKSKRKQKQQLQPKKKESICNIESVIVGGYDECYQLGERPNNQDEDGSPIITPPVRLSFDPSSLLSYSTYCSHAVLVMNDGSLKGVGLNKDGRISSTLQKTLVRDFTDFRINDSNGQQLSAVSAVCYEHGTLYMLSKNDGYQLVLCDKDINGGDPVFLDIGNHQPVSLFGGCSYAAAIGSEGEIIFINRNSVKKSPGMQIDTFSLPDGEKASSVACCDSSVFVLSTNGRVFKLRVLNFSIVEELSGHEIVCLSGTYCHCLAVSNDGRVFGCGSNEFGQLALGKGTESVPSFNEIASLNNLEIRHAYADYNHSLFQTRDGKIMSCGDNYSGQLILGSGAGKRAYSQKETTIANGAAFCIAGNASSVVFIGSSPPPNMPNMRNQ